MESINEINTQNRICSTIEDYDDGELVFSEADMKLWKKKEKALMQRYEKGYYRCKHKHAEVYEELLTLYKPYITEEALRMLAHPYSTQSNEAMNKSVSCFSPKGKTFSRTESLDTRVGIAGGIQVLGYELFWQEIFQEFNMTLDDSLRAFLRNLQKRKDAKNKLARSKAGKSRRSNQRRNKLKDEHRKDMEAQKTGMLYETGIAMKQAQRGARHLTSAQSRNPKGTPKDKLRCRYWHRDYCQVYGHSVASSNDCFMKTKSKEEREAAATRIMEENIETELRVNSEKGNCTYVQFIHE
jgi:hypothetical protein